MNTFDSQPHNHWFQHCFWPKKKFTNLLISQFLVSIPATSYSIYPILDLAFCLVKVSFGIIYKLKPLRIDDRNLCYLFDSIYFFQQNFKLEHFFQCQFESNSIKFFVNLHFINLLILKIICFFLGPKNLNIASPSKRIHPESSFMLFKKKSLR